MSVQDCVAVYTASLAEQQQYIYIHVHVHVHIRIFGVSTD